jgi:hypothetical protein
MANNGYRQVDVEFPTGTWHSLRFNFNAFAALEKELGQPVTKLEFANMTANTALSSGFAAP